jgi:hypothetical protein
MSSSNITVHSDAIHFILLLHHLWFVLCLVIWLISFSLSSPSEEFQLAQPPVLLLVEFCYYWCEAWTLTNQDEQYLRIFECRILRKIFGPVQNEDGSWRIRMNHKLNEIIENADIVWFIKSRRIAWPGHVIWMDEKRTHKRVLEWEPIGRRIRGRPRKMDWGHWRRYTEDRTKRVEKVM